MTSLCCMPNCSGSSSPVLTGSLLPSRPLGCSGLLPALAEALPVKFLLLLIPCPPLSPLGPDQLIHLSGLQSPAFCRHCRQRLSPALHLHCLLPAQSPNEALQPVIQCHPAGILRTRVNPHPAQSQTPLAGAFTCVLAPLARLCSALLRTLQHPASLHGCRSRMVYMCLSFSHPM